MEEKNIVITVIIAAYGRRTFLKEAIASALDQTLPRSKYEIVVIKNFRDKDIDSYIKKNHLKSVLSNTASNGGFIIDAFKKSRGDVICFLDDDDKFTRDKLQHVYAEFEKDPRLVFYHNNYKVINAKGKIIEELSNKYRYKNIGKERFVRAAFNNSSVSIRRKLFVGNISDWKKTKLSIDTLALAFAVKDGGGIKFSNDELTLYRIHGANSSTKNVTEEDLSDFITRKQEIQRRFYEVSTLFCNIVKNTMYEPEFRRFNIESKLKYKIYSFNDLDKQILPKFKDYIDTLTHPTKERLILVFLSILPQRLKRVAIKRIMVKRHSDVISIQYQ